MRNAPFAVVRRLVDLPGARNHNGSGFGLRIGGTMSLPDGWSQSEGWR
jgi:hypothetical protein